LPPAAEFLRLGGIAQDRYEDLRRRWMSPDSPGTIGLARLPWGRRLIHFGLLGLLDEDVTGGAWFGAGASSPTAPDVRCTRVLLAADEADVRAREAYRCVLASFCAPIAATEGSG